MNLSPSDQSGTRMLFLGEAALADGFQLIGFETWPEAGKDQLERVLKTLLEQRCKAFVIIDSDLATADSPTLQRVRAEGGRIIIIEVPPLHDPEHFHSDTLDQVRALFGDSKEKMLT